MNQILTKKIIPKVKRMSDRIAKHKIFEKKDLLINIDRLIYFFKILKNEKMFFHI